MSRSVRTPAVDGLCDAILSLQNRDECYRFFEDVCTVNELTSLSQRFAVAKMLTEKKTYLEIAGDSAGDRCFYSYNKQGKPCAALWERRVFHGIGET